MSGAAPLGAELADAVSERVGCPVMQGYGMTELSPVSHLVDPEQSKGKGGHIGPAVANTECRIVDPESGSDSDRGELWVRGPQVMKGYINNEEATAETIDSDGWLRTGDVAVVDDDGYFQIVDRLKELIKYNGFQVPPAELEGILRLAPLDLRCGRDRDPRRRLRRAAEGVRRRRRRRLRRRDPRVRRRARSRRRSACG